MNVIFLGSGWLGFVDALRERAGTELSIHVWDRESPIAEAVRDADVILPSNARLSAEVLAAAPRAVLIQQPAAGFEGIDLDAARARGIPVCNAPGCNHRAVAEAALLLMLALVRRLPEAQRALAAVDIGAPTGTELCGKTLGIIGLGRAGSALARIAEGLGMRVIATTSKSTAAELGDLLSAADIISLHVPLTAKTRGLIDAAALARTRRGALLINCARGAVIDRAALEAALDSGHLAGVGLDTVWNEPPAHGQPGRPWNPADPLFARDNVIVLPHIAGSTREAFARVADIVVDNIRRVMAGEPPKHRIA